MSDCRRRAARWIAICAALWATPPVLAAANTVFLEELTSTELRDRIAAGATSVLVPIGGTEQNGAHIVLGKHNVRVRALAGRIAERLGQAVVAPVMAYVPEGAIEPPTQHMRWAGTISVPEAAFEAVVEASARSFRRHGFRQVILLGDHGGYQASLARVADKLNREWARQPAYRVVALSEYYRASQADFADMLKAKGFAAVEIGQHAGLADTSLAMAVQADLVRRDQLDTAAQSGGGVSGDPRRSSAELGQIGVDHIVAVSVAAIRQRSAARELMIKTRP